MKASHSLAALVFLFAAAGTFTTAAESIGSGNSQHALNHIVAIVNDGIIVSTELNTAMESVVKQLNEKKTPLPPRSVLAKQVLERLVVEKLQLQIANTNSMNIDDSTINNEVQDLARNNNLTVAEFRSVLEQDGYDFTAFRDDLRKQMLIQQVRRQMVGSRIKVSEQEIDNLLATIQASGKGDIEYHLAHILVAIPEASSPNQIQALEARANKLLEQLRTGGNFAEIAISKSDGQTALEGGDIGWRSIGQMPSLFVDPVKTMEIGAVSDLIRSSGGFHIIKLVEKRGDERHILRQTRARHILLKPDVVHSSDENLKRIRQLEIRLQAGEDFEVLARSNSQDTLSAAKGGDLGWVGAGETVPKFEEAMDKLKPGEISKPVRTEFGWHLVQVTERRDHDSTVEFEHNKARSLIRSRKYDEELFLWLRRLRDEAYVDYRLDDV